MYNSHVFSPEKIKSEGNTFSSLYSRVLVVPLLWDKILQTQDVSVDVYISPNLFPTKLLDFPTLWKMLKNHRVLLIPGPLKSSSHHTCYCEPALGPGISTCSRKAFFALTGQITTALIKTGLWICFKKANLGRIASPNNDSDLVYLADWISVAVLNLELEWLLRNSSLTPETTGGWGDCGSHKFQNFWGYPVFSSWPT